MTITLAVLLGFALDWLLGDPKKLPHPVCAVGKTHLRNRKSAAPHLSRNDPRH